VALLIIHLLVPRVEPLGEVDDAVPQPFSVGSIVGFGFVGSIFGSFGGWCVGLLSRTSGSHLLEYMATGLVVGAVIGVISGVLITSAGAKAQGRMS
jgi:H+/Cl- antiporter ClcA